MNLHITVACCIIWMQLMHDQINVVVFCAFHANSIIYNAFLWVLHNSVGNKWFLWLVSQFSNFQDCEQFLLLLLQLLCSPVWLLMIHIRHLPRLPSSSSFFFSLDSTGFLLGFHFVQFVTFHWRLWFHPLIWDFLFIEVNFIFLKVCSTQIILVFR